MKVIIETSYTVTISTTVDLPEGRTPDDIEQIVCKWGKLDVEFKDEKEWETYEENDFSMEDCDWKHPDRIVVYNEDYEQMGEWV